MLYPAFLSLSRCFDVILGSARVLTDGCTLMLRMQSTFLVTLTLLLLCL